MSRSFAAFCCWHSQRLYAPRTARCRHSRGRVIRRLGNTNGRSAFELHDPTFSPASDSLARLRRVQVERQEEKPAVDRHGDPRPRTYADKQSAVRLLLASGIG